MSRYLWVLLALLFVISCRTSPESEGQLRTVPKTDRVTDSDKDIERNQRFDWEWKPNRKGLISAHRGGSYPGYPENCIETFSYVLEHTPAIIECDFALSRDSVIVMMHDKTLDRTTTGRGPVGKFSYDELQALRLLDLNGDTTDFKIQTLDEVLDWGRGKCYFTLDIKGAVTMEMVVDRIQHFGAHDYAFIIAYTIEDAKHIHKLDPHIRISVGANNIPNMKRALRSGIPKNKLLAFVGVSEPASEIYERLHREGIYCILGTLGNLDKKAAAKGDMLYIDWLRNGADILATDRPIEAAAVVNDKANALKYRK